MDCKIIEHITVIILYKCIYRTTALHCFLLSILVGRPTCIPQVFFVPVSAHFRVDIYVPRKRRSAFLRIYLTENFTILKPQNPEIENFMLFRNVVRRILKLKSCEKVGRVGRRIRFFVGH